MNKELRKKFSNWFLDNKLSIYFGEVKIKSVLFSTKNRNKKIGNQVIHYGDAKIKQYSKVTCLGCELDEAQSLKPINKVNGKFKFLYRKNRYLTPYLK